MATVRVEGSDGKFTEFEGDLVAETSTYREAKLRWFEVRLYRSKHGWTVHRSSMSDVFHQLDTPCRIRPGGKPGRIGLARDLDPDNAVPCPDCRPPYDLPPDTQIRIETPRHTITHCATAEDVVIDLATDRKTGEVRITGPVADLLAKAAAAAPEFGSVPQMQPQKTIRLY